MKLLVNYDPATGIVTLPDGITATASMGLNYPEYQEGDSKPSLSAIIKLKDAGFDADEIMMMGKAGMV